MQLPVNPFVPNAPFLYFLKTSEHLTVFCFFQGVEKRCIWNESVNLFIASDTTVNPKYFYLKHDRTRDSVYFYDMWECVANHVPFLIDLS